MLSRRQMLAGSVLLLAAADAPPVQIYAAMTFRPALDAVLNSYRGVKPLGVYAPTPILVRQLEQGAPADLLLTADPIWMDEAAKRHLILPETRTNLLQNSLVLAGWAGKPDAGAVSASFPLLAAMGDRGLVMCDPDHDPAGRYAKQSLVALGFWPQVSNRVVVAESSPAAVTLLDRREIQVAAVFATDLAKDKGVAVLGTFPADSHSPIVYPLARTTGSKNPETAQVLAFLRSPQAMQVFQSFGYIPAG
jgi:molybdate transport system substrate-binding protein